MAQVIAFGNELIRINPSDHFQIQYSKSNGRIWSIRYKGTKTSPGQFLDLLNNGAEILAITTNGTYYTKSNGTTWTKRS